MRERTAELRTHRVAVESDTRGRPWSTRATVLGALLVVGSGIAGAVTATTITTSLAMLAQQRREVHDAIERADEKDRAQRCHDELDAELSCRKDRPAR